MAVQTKKKRRATTTGIRATLEHLPIEDGDLILVEADPALVRDKQKLFDVISRWLEGRKVDVAVIEVPDGLTVEAISEALIRKSGWVRPEEIEGLEATLTVDAEGELGHQLRRLRDIYRECQTAARHGQADLEPLRKQVHRLVRLVDTIYTDEPDE